MKDRKVIGVMGAMESEVSGLVASMEVEGAGRTAGFEYWTGRLQGRECVVARCGMGKVSAASGVQRLIDEWRIECLVVCGLAGGLHPELGVGDIVIGERFVQYDLDASPIFPRFEVPGLGVTLFEADASLVRAADASSASVVLALRHGGALTSEREQRVRKGLIATGDQFVKDDKRLDIVRDFPDALCVDMEGGAIAQVCSVNGVRFVVVRVISDTADGDAPRDFMRFVSEEAPTYTVSIVKELIRKV